MAMTMRMLSSATRHALRARPSSIMTRCLIRAVPLAATVVPSPSRGRATVAPAWTMTPRCTRGLATHAPIAVPKLFIYDHCPFCARVRLLLGLKKIDHELAFLMNHDEATPIGLVGSKQVPILITPEGKAMAESLDIVKYLDENHGGPAILKPSADREDVKAWIKESTPVFLQLTHARFHQSPFGEFVQLASRDYYQQKKEFHLGATFEELLVQSDELVAKANTLLEELDSLLYSETTVNEALSYDDIDIFPRLRGITVVKGIKWPTKVRAYIDHFSKEGDVLLFDRIAF